MQNCKISYSWFAGLLLSIYASQALAYETDQYTPPNAELADVGEDLSEFIADSIKKTLDKAHKDLVSLPERIRLQKLDLQEKEAKLQNISDPLSEHHNMAYDASKRKLDKLEKRYQDIQTESGIVRAIFESYSGKITWQDQRDGVFGLPLSIIPYPNNTKEGKTILFDPGKTGNIYAFAGFHRIISPSYFVFASTLRAYDVYMGFDKFGHFLNQGFEYFQIYTEAIAEGKSDLEAKQKIVRWGAKSENGIFGKIVDGVYSNGDLAANYAGFYFYKNLFSDVQINGVTIPRLIEKNDDGSYRLRESLEAKTLLKPFITQHLNEALNPSVVERLQRGPIRTAVKNRCERWKDFYQMYNQEYLRDLTNALFSWNQEDYGHQNHKLVRVDEICFADQKEGLTEQFLNNDQP